MARGVGGGGRVVRSYYTIDARIEILNRGDTCFFSKIPLCLYSSLGKCNQWVAEFEFLEAPLINET